KISLTREITPSVKRTGDPPSVPEVADTVAVPPLAAVVSVVAARPVESLWDEAGESVPAPAVMAQFTVTPGTPFPNVSTTCTVIGAGSRVAGPALWRSPPALTSRLAGPGRTVSVNDA